MRALLLIILGFCFIYFVQCHSHSHSHSEPAHFKYSKEANKPPAEDGEEGFDQDEHPNESGDSHEKVPAHSQEGHDHSHKGHGHSHDKAPGHSHEGHGHSHESHGDSHEKAPGHSDEKAPDHSHEKAPDQSHEKAPDQSHEKAPDHSHEKAPDKSHEKAPEQSHEKASDQSHEKAPDQSHEKAPDQSHEKAPDQSHEKAPDQSHEKIPDQSHEKAPDQSHEKAPGHEGHGHSHEGHGHSHEKAPSHEGHGHSHEGHGHSHEAQYGGQKSDGHGHSHDANKAQSPPKTVSKSDSLLDAMWLRAIAATGLISAAPIIILWFIPLDNSQKHNSLLKVLLSFASGGLLGDAFLHLIPHAIDPHEPNAADHSHSHSHSAGGHSHDHSKNMHVGLWVVAGIMCFLCVEKFVRFVKGGHGHTHSVAAPSTESKSGDKKKKEVKPQKQEDIKVAGYLNLAADFAHNFTDGLAIGASFLVSDSIGIVTTITILFHEIPHEIGDFAILVQSGCSKRRAMFLQLTTAIGAMLGTLCSLLAQGAGQAATAWILPFTAGGFIYIATVSVIPELLEDSKPFQSVKEILAMIVGVAMMIVIAFYE